MRPAMPHRGCEPTVRRKAGMDCFTSFAMTGHRDISTAIACGGFAFAADGGGGVALLYPRHCERSEAIQPTTQERMDCVVAALLAMTAGVMGKRTFPVQYSNRLKRQQSAFPRRRWRPSLANSSRPRTKRAQGMPGARCTRSRVCVKKCTRVATTGTPHHPAFPAQWF
jgi:hypothetical protein